MGIQGEYLDKHSRKYVSFNPNEFSGPFTWRLSMMPTFAVDPDDITTIFTILPIDSNVEPDGSMNLFFNIDGLENISDSARRLNGRPAAKAMLNLPGVSERSLFGLKAVTGVAPVQTDERGTDVAIYFDIDSLPNFETRKGYFRVSANDYNSRSIDKLSADKPLFVQNGLNDDAIVSFDISSLELG